MQLAQRLDWMYFGRDTLEHVGRKTTQSARQTPGDFNSFLGRGLVLLGCGKMGSALLKGWLDGGLDKSLVHVIEPFPSGWLRSQEIKVGPVPKGAKPAFCIIAVKPQMMSQAISSLKSLGGGESVILSIAAGTWIRFFEQQLGSKTPIIRAMPNTPAAIGCGISAFVGNRCVNDEQLDQAEMLLGAVGDTVRLSDESDIDAVTAVSGSGPAYVFLLIETLAQAGVQEGLSETVAMQLAISTVAGAGQLALLDEKPAHQLRKDVTSPGGTTAAALQHLMAPETGLAELMARAVHAALERGRELGSE